MVTLYSLDTIYIELTNVIYRKEPSTIEFCRGWVIEESFTFVKRTRSDSLQTDWYMEAFKTARKNWRTRLGCYLVYGTVERGNIENTIMVIIPDRKKQHCYLIFNHI
ncbi:hypothetical protein HZS_5651 [Henneguya salminicola]|nr:hypothetical protein HZS_5651 [Henneguya salminicola]